MQNLTIANAIRNQLGQKALFMMGATNFMGDVNSLSFKISGSKSTTHIKIKLAYNDTYQITFYKKFKETVFDGIQVAELHETISRFTKLNVSL